MMRTSADHRINPAHPDVTRDENGIGHHPPLPRRAAIYFNDTLRLRDDGQWRRAVWCMERYVKPKIGGGQWKLMNATPNRTDLLKGIRASKQIRDIVNRLPASFDHGALAALKRELDLPDAQSATQSKERNQ